MLSIDPAKESKQLLSVVLGIYPKDIPLRNIKANMYKIIHCVVICNCAVLETP